MEVLEKILKKYYRRNTKGSIGKNVYFKIDGVNLLYPDRYWFTASMYSW